MHDTAEVTLELAPKARFDVIDVSRRIREQHGDLLANYQRAMYCSYHTTAGYLEQNIIRRLGNDPKSVEEFIRAFHSLFPPEAGYHHDRLDERVELSESQRQVEPLNADSHLTYISSGLENCVTYWHDPNQPVFFVDLDGINETMRRRRRTTVIGFNEEEVVDSFALPVPVSAHAIDSINLRSPELALFDHVRQRIEHYGIAKGRVDIILEPTERHVGLTVNEYETLLMKHDLREVLNDPLRFMAEKTRSIIRDPRAVPGKAKNYAKYDLVRLINRVMDKLGLNESVVERLVDKFIEYPASHFLRMRRSVSMLINNTNADGIGTVIQGRYQSPILVQWRKSDRGTRTVKVQVVRLR